jgi:hypothetical protein
VDQEHWPLGRGCPRTAVRAEVTEHPVHDRQATENLWLDARGFLDRSAPSNRTPPPSEVSTALKGSHRARVSIGRHRWSSYRCGTQSSLDPAPSPFLANRRASTGGLWLRPRRFTTVPYRLRNVSPKSSDRCAPVRRPGGRGCLSWFLPFGRRNHDHHRVNLPSDRPG